MYEMTDFRKPLFIIAETMEGSVFGAFISTGWPTDRGDNPGFSGDGETFLFTLEPFAKMYSWVGLTQENDKNGEAETEPLKPEFSMFLCAARRQLIIGGGRYVYFLSAHVVVTLA